MKVASCLVTPIYHKKKEINKLQLKEQKQKARPLKHLIKDTKLMTW